MDSRLDDLNLPVVKPDITGPGVADLEGPNNPPYRVAFLMHHYFEWVGTFESGAFAGIAHWRNNSCDHVTKKRRFRQRHLLRTGCEYNDSEERRLL
jgi:hypothetical protein